MYKKFWLLLSFIIFASCLFPAQAEEPFRIERATVNGMNILLQKTSSKLVDITLLLKSGSGLDPKGKKGTAEIMNSLVWLKLKYSKAELGQVDIRTFPEFTLVTITATTGNFNRALEEIKYLLSYPLYSYDIITDLKGFISTGVKGQPAVSKSYYEFSREFYGADHPYNDGMDPDQISAINGRDVYRWYRQTYQPGNAILSISGGVSQSIEGIQKVFVKLESESVDNGFLIDPILLDHNQQVEREDPNGKVASISIGFSAPRFQDPEYPAFRIIAYYLEEYQHYFEELRVKEGLVYAGFVYYNYLEKPKAPCIVFLTMTGPESLNLVQAKTLEVADKLAGDGIDQKEIDQVVKAIKVESAARKAAGKGFATRNALSHYLQNQLANDDNLLPKLEQIKTDDIKKAAAKYFKHYIRVAFIPQKIEDNL
jgi:predicted Zn-dependent peptidase